MKKKEYERIAAVYQGNKASDEFMKLVGFEGMESYASKQFTDYDHYIEEVDCSDELERLLDNIKLKKYSTVLVWSRELCGKQEYDRISRRCRYYNVKLLQYVKQLPEYDRKFARDCQKKRIYIWPDFEEQKMLYKEIMLEQENKLEKMRLEHNEYTGWKSIEDLMNPEI